MKSDLLKKYTERKLGMRYKEVDDGIIIYANAWTLTVDIFKWIFSKLKKLWKKITQH